MCASYKKSAVNVFYKDLSVLGLHMKDEMKTKGIV